MVMASNSASSLSRPWVLATTGFIAAYGTYLIWSNWPSTDPSASIQRRNIVRNRTRQRSSTRLHSSPPASGAPLNFGVLHVEHDGTTITFPIGPEPPTVTQLQEAFHIANSSAYEIAIEAQRVALKRIFQALVQSPDNTSIEQSESARDLSPLVSALRRRDIDSLIAKIHVLCSGRWHFDQTAVARAFTDHCGLDRIPMDPDRADLGLTETSADSDRENESEPAQGVKSIVYSIAEETAKRAAYVHRGIRCEQCSELPIRGIRWHCINCPDFDLCSTCEAQAMHPRTHVFAKIKVPIPLLNQPHEVSDVWYPGDATRRWPNLKISLRKRLAVESGFEDLRIEALYDQFSCTANVGLPNDPMEIYAAIDRRAFNKALMSAQWKSPLKPNFLYDRMFSFYDTDNNGLIDFGEYISGIAFLSQPAKRTSLARVFQGYDADGDGYISRRDLVRMLSAKYAVQKNIVQDVIKAEELEMARGAADIVRSSQPISAAFTHEDVPLGRSRTPIMKSPDSFGEDQIRVNGAFGQAVLPNGEELPDSTFLQAVVDRYDIDPPTVHTVQDRIDFRNRFTRCESVPVSNEDEEGEQMFMVETDSRATRGQADIEPPEDRWRQDIRDAAIPSEDPNTALAATYDESQQLPELSDRILEKGRAYQVPSMEKDFGTDVIFQVHQESFNEMIDPIFKEREDLAVSVRETRDERRQFRKEINEYVQAKKAFQEELKSGSEIDPLLATANAANFGEQGSRRDQQETSVPPDPVVHINPVDGASEIRPSQRDVAQEIREQIAQQNDQTPTDDESLEDMEADIRSQSLDALLRQTGYIVEFSEGETHDEFPMQDGDESQDRGEPLPISPLAEEFTPSEGGGDESVSFDDILSDTLDPNQDGLSPISSSNDPTDTNASSHPNSPTAPMRSNSHSPPTPLALPMQTPFSTPSMLSSASVPSLPPPHRSLPTEQSKVPSKRRLEELSRLDEEEKQILVRGGPGRVNLEELENIIREERGGSLKGLFESWLEWAEF